jgi:hypothetical protein
LGLLQGWLDIGAMVILSLLCFIWAGRTLLGFCLLTLISSGSGRTQLLFQPCKQALPVGGNFFEHHILIGNLTKYSQKIKLPYRTTFVYLQCEQFQKI